MSDKKYYPILIDYVGPRNGFIILAKRIRIQEFPGKTNMSGEIKLNGWLGTTDNWNKTALGELTEDETRKLLKSYGINIPNTSEIKLDDYFFDYETSEEYNQLWLY